MKVIHILFCFYPDRVGGTEIYVEALAGHLQDLGIEAVVAAPGPANHSYRHNQLRVRRFAQTDQTTDLSEMYSDGDALATEEFINLFEEERPDVVHFHSFTRAVSVQLVRAAKARNIRVVLTYHVPGISCQRHTLLRWGEEVCDGRLDNHLCAGCTLNGLGLNRPTARAVGALPPSLGRWLGRRGVKGRVWTALRMTELVALRHAAFHAMTAEVDQIVALCEWVRQLLLLNGVPGSKITLCRHGLAQEMVAQPEAAEPGPARRSSSELRIAFLGRLDPSKGVHVLIEAFRMMGSANVRLDLYGIALGKSGVDYEKRMRELAAGDRRIFFHPSVPSSEVVYILRRHDVLAVPSQWMETGPLVVLEAFAAGIPVIGSNLGGIAELVKHQTNGLLVEFKSPAEWARTLQHLTDHPELLAHLRSGIRAPRKMAEVADEMAALYRSVTRYQAVAPRPLTADA